MLDNMIEWICFWAGDDGELERLNEPNKEDDERRMFAIAASKFNTTWKSLKEGAQGRKIKIMKMLKRK